MLFDFPLLLRHLLLLKAHFLHIHPFHHHLPIHLLKILNFLKIVIKLLVKNFRNMFFSNIKVQSYYCSISFPNQHLFIIVIKFFHSILIHQDQRNLVPLISLFSLNHLILSFFIRVLNFVKSIS